MNVIARMINDHKRRVTAEASGFVFEEKERFSVKKIRNTIVGLLLFFIAIFTGLQYAALQSDQVLTEQLVAIKPEHDLVKTDEAMTSTMPEAENPFAEPETRTPLKLAKKEPEIVAMNSASPEPAHKKKSVARNKPAPQVKSQSIPVHTQITTTKPKKTKQESTRKDLAAKAHTPKNLASAKLEPKASVKETQLAMNTVASTTNSPQPIQKPAETISKKVHQPTKLQLAQSTYAAGLKLVKKKELRKAEEYMLRALELNPQHFKARELLAGIYIRRKDNAQAVNVLLDGVKNNPSFFKFRELLVRLYVDQSQSEQGLLILDDATELQKQSAKYQGLRAAVLQGLGRFKEAITAYDAALAIQPNEARLWLGLGLSHESVEQYTQAEKAYVQVGQLSNLDPDLRKYVEQRLAVVRLHTTAAL